jgi:hypothetical protein
MRVDRKTIVADTETTWDNLVGEYFLVKNFTSGPIIVCNGSYVESNGVKIPTETAEVIRPHSSTLIIKGTNAGEVEVRCIED